MSWYNFSKSDIEYQILDDDDKNDNPRHKKTLWDRFLDVIGLSEEEQEKQRVDYVNKTEKRLAKVRSAIKELETSPPSLFYSRSFVAGYLRDARDLERYYLEEIRLYSAMPGGSLSVFPGPYLRGL